MNCKEFESLTADALGGELAAEQQSAFDAHIAACESCRREYESLTATVQQVASLPPAPPVRIERSGEQLVIAPETAAPPRRSWATGRAARFAAAIALAFVAGYAFRASAPPTDDRQQPDERIAVVEPDRQPRSTPRRPSLEARVADATRSGRSAFSIMSAVFPSS